ncbi:hypothetical protein QTO34_007631 [Cnephaeus nilssonii]|uniref:Uncharacterized protein n=1 Tax=Cnephaeus nilssonii TaxID=3371016 RepID=A0AA40HIQ1_CNENI|nr:hypothetical protein QTO34_007631 [Eptesicus nilssonii]
MGKDMKIKSLEEIYLFSLPIKESEIIDFFLGATLKEEVLNIMPVQKQTRQYKSRPVLREAQGTGLGVARVANWASGTLSSRCQRRRKLSVCAMAVLQNRRGLWDSELTSHRGPSKAGELSACLLRHQAFQKPPLSRRLLKGLMSFRTTFQTKRDWEESPDPGCLLVARGKSGPGCQKEAEGRPTLARISTPLGRENKNHRRLEQDIPSAGHSLCPESLDLGMVPGHFFKERRRRPRPALALQATPLGRFPWGGRTIRVEPHWEGDTLRKVSLGWPGHQGRATLGSNNVATAHLH